MDRRLLGSVHTVTVALLVITGLTHTSLANGVDLNSVDWVRLDAVRVSYSIGGAHRATLLSFERSWFSSIRRLGLGTTLVEASWDDYSPYERNAPSYDVLPLEVTFLLWGRDATAERLLYDPEMNRRNPPKPGWAWFRRTYGHIIAPLVYLRMEATAWGNRMDGPPQLPKGGRGSRGSKRLDASINYASNLGGLDMTWEFSAGILLLNSPSKWGYAEIDQRDPYLKLSFGWFGSWEYTKH